MRPEEAAWIGSLLGALEDRDVAVVVNIGSSTGHFRSVTQPHIEDRIFGPLAERGSRVIHCDMKKAPGVDLVGDLLDPQFGSLVADLRADVVLANNLFEHVRDRAGLARAIARLPRPGGRLIVTVPHRYPYHADPIDTLYRPEPQEIAALFPGFAVEAAEIIGTTTIWQDLVAGMGEDGARRHLRSRYARALVPFFRPRAWWATLAAIAWLRRPRSVSGACLRKPSQGDGTGAL